MKKILFFLTIVAVAFVFQIAGFQTEANAAWGPDVRVANEDHPNIDLSQPSMDEAPNGDLYLAMHWSATVVPGIEFYKSIDGGKTWSYITSHNGGVRYSFTEHSLAYAAGSEDWVFTTYGRHEDDYTRSIMLYRFNPANPGINNDVTIASGMPAGIVLKPEICTDTPYYEDNYYVYVTYCVPAADYYAVYFTRSENRGLNWSAPVEVTGTIGSNSSWQTTPDIAYGPAGLYIAFEKLAWNGSSWINQVWVTRSTNSGYNWNTPVQVTSSTSSYPAYHPRIAVASNGSVMVAYTVDYGGGDTDIESSYSTDGGLTWSPLDLPWTSDTEQEVELSVSTSNGRFHAVYFREEDIWYSWADATNPSLGWSSPAVVVNELNAASHNHLRPAVCPNPTLSVELEACVAWTDYRNTVYDIYFDQVSTCGNGVLEGGEECDDGNTLNGDCCSATCTFEPYGSPCDNPDSTDCSAPDTCTGNGFCSANDYPAGTPCTSDGNMCTDDACNDYGICLHYLNTDPCDDYLFCTGADTCNAGTCSIHAGNPCLAFPGTVCNETTDTCDPSQVCGNGVLEGSEQCDDGNTVNADCCSATCIFEAFGSPCGNQDTTACTDPDSCTGDGYCSPRNQPAGTQCTTDGNMCTDDECDGLGVCIHINNTDPCDDYLFCTGADTCSGGTCSVHSGDPCFPLLCDEITNTCSGGSDFDGDGVPDSLDNCTYQYNPGQEDLDSDGIGDACDNCPRLYNQYQEDTYPPQTNGCGDACECEGNFNGWEDQDVDGSDAFIFKTDFGRSRILNPCTNADPCNGDFFCEADVDGTDAFTFKSDFGRSSILNPCPYCVTIPWCVY